MEFRRRDLLAFGAGAALFPSISWAALEPGNGLVLGYCREPDGEGLATTVVPAERLAAGDPELARRGARVTVHGIVGDAERLGRMGIRAVELTVRYELQEAGCDAVDVHAWSYQLLPVEQHGSANAFTVPVDDGLRLALEVETLGSEHREAVLVTGGDRGRPKLRAGRYLIAPADTLPRRFDPARPEPLIALSVETL